MGISGEIRRALCVTVEPDGTVLLNTGSEQGALEIGKIKPGEKFNLNVQDISVHDKTSLITSPPRVALQSASKD